MPNNEILSLSDKDFLSLVEEKSTEVVSVLDLDLKFIRLSTASKKVFGFNPADLVGATFLSYLHQEDIAKFEQLPKSNLKNKSITYRFKRSDNVFIWLESVISLENINSTQCLVIVSRDITFKKYSEDLIKRFQAAVEQASDLIAMADTDGKIVYVNPSVVQMTGYTQGEVIGKHANFLWGGNNSQKMIDSMWKSLTVRKSSYYGEIPNVAKNGTEYVSQVHISPILDSSKNIAFYVGISRDITKIKEVDRMKTEFISLASHQLRTPLTAIKWRLEILLEQIKGNKEWNDKLQFLKEIDRSNERMIDLVNALLNISRIESGRLMIDPRLTSIEELLLGVLDDVEKLIKEKELDINLSFQTNIFDIKCDPKLISNVFLNIISNSIKYTPQKGKIEISVYLQGDEIITKISDTGFGIPEAEQTRIFEKFYRGSNIKKIITEGTGLGLYLVKSIMFESNGRIWFESKEGKGTTFWIALNTKGVEARKGEVSIT